MLGVAAPSQQQVPLNWVYPPLPNPYNLERRLTGYVNQIYVQAAGSDAAHVAIRQATDILVRRHRIRPGEANDFQIRNLSQIAETAETSSHIMAAPAYGGGVNITDRRWDRHYEYPSGFGDGANARNWTSDGDWR